MNPKIKFLTRALVAGVIIWAILTAIFDLSTLISKSIGLPLTVVFPLPMRIIGLVITGIALAETIWLFSYRQPQDMILSTYFTFMKLFRLVPIDKNAERTEPLVFSGPQKYVRHPLYLGLMLAVFGWAFLMGNISDLVAIPILVVWFRFVLIPFEEKELRSVFGDQFTRYADATPMLIPFNCRKYGLNHIFSKKS